MKKVVTILVCVVILTTALLVYSAGKASALSCGLAGGTVTVTPGQGWSSYLPASGFATGMYYLDIRYTSNFPLLVTLQANPGWYKPSSRRYGFTGPQTTIWTSFTVSPSALLGSSGTIVSSIYNSLGQTVCQSTLTVIVNDTGSWTAWLDRDDPGGSGDWETRADFSGVCAAPKYIEAQTLSGVDWTKTGETLTVSPSVGLVCQNASQSDGACQDYRVRFFCQ